MSVEKNRCILNYIVFIAVVILMGNTLLYGETENPKDLFGKANSYYEDGEYDRAIEEYRKILNAGFEGGNLYYNIGNSYFKKGDTGHALLNYERARRFIPADRDLRSNNDFAMTKVERATAQVFRKWFMAVVEKTFSRISLNNLTLFLTFLYMAVIGLTIASMFNGLVKRYLGYVLLLIMCIFVLGSVSLAERIKLVNTGFMVTDGSVDVKFAPFEEGTLFFFLYQGDKVYVIDSKEGWRKIKRVDGKLGWVKSSSIEKI